jgi:hypothetical protein
MGSKIPDQVWNDENRGWAARFLIKSGMMKIGDAQGRKGSSLDIIPFTP